MPQSFVQEVQTPGGLSPEELKKVQGLYENILLQTDTSNPHTIAGRIPRTYAEALLIAAIAQGVVSGVAENFISLGTDVFPNAPGFEQFLTGSLVSKKVKDETIVKVFEGRAVPLFVDFLRVLNRKDRLGMLRPIAIAFRTLLDARANRVRVLVETAAPLADDQKQKLTDTLAAELKRTPILVVRENPDLIGGLVVHVGDKVFDTSVRSKLETIRNHLLARGSHEIQSGRNRFGDF